MATKRKKALVLYNGSTRGNLSGGEYAHKKIRALLRESYDVREILPDDLVSKFHSRVLKRLLSKAAVPLMVLLSFILYSRYDIVITSWTPKIPYFGDITYVQPFSQADTVFGNFDAAKNVNSILSDALMSIPNKLLSGPSRRRHMFVVNSAYTQQRLRREMQLDSIVIYPPVPFHRPELEPRKEDLVLSVGRVVPSKRFEAICQVGPLLPKAKFVLVGTSGPNGEKIISAISESFMRNGSSENFVYLGWVPDNEKDSLLARSKVIFHPSIDEPFGIAIVEGMAKGAIPVVHNSGGPREFVPSEWLFDNYEQATEKIKVALETWSPEIGRSMREISSRFSELNFEKAFSHALLLRLAHRTRND